jgi:hypothetical protein
MDQQQQSKDVLVECEDCKMVAKIITFGVPNANGDLFFDQDLDLSCPFCKHKVFIKHDEERIV